MKRVLSLTLCLLMLTACLLGCAAKAPTGLWANATYTEDTTLGEGAKTVKVAVKAEDTAITFTIKTDAEMLGEALLEHKLVEGEQGEFGLYIKEVNGIGADFSKDGAYWALYQDGEYAMAGVDTTPIADGAHYELVHTKG